MNNLAITLWHQGEATAARQLQQAAAALLPRNRDTHGRGAGKPEPDWFGLPRRQRCIEIDSIVPRRYMTTWLLTELARSMSLR